MLVFSILAIILEILLFALVMLAPLGMGLSWFFAGVITFLTIDSIILIFVSVKQMLAFKGKDRAIGAVSMALYIIATLLGIAFMTISIIYNVLTFHAASSLALLF